MSSRFPIAPLLGALIHVVRHEPESTGPQGALLAALRTALDGRGLRIAAEADVLLLDDEAIPLSVPGATLLNEQLRMHGLAALELPAGIEAAELLRLAGVLAAFAGTFGSLAEVVVALGPGGARFQVVPAAEEPGSYAHSWHPREVSSGRPLELAPIDIQRDSAEGITLAVPTPEGDAAQLTGGVPAPVRTPLGVILERGRRAAAQENWSALLDAGLQLMDAEDAEPSDHIRETYRLELRRLVSREQLGMIARLAHGDRRQEAIGMLRRFGPVATETLVELLIASASLAERRGYYTAITQMGEGAEAIIGQLGHPLWYVVRNAAELCGDMELAHAVPALGRQCQHPDERVRKSVAGALGRIATPLALPWIARMLGDGSPAVRRQVLVHLAGLRVRELCEAIAELLERESNAEVQREALLALGRIGSEAAIQALESWSAPESRRFGKKSAALRVLAIKGLALAGPGTTNILSRLTRDAAPEVRAAASAALDALRP